MTKSEHLITLDDGRTLQALELGPPEGRPVIYLHGAPGSCQDHSHHGELFSQGGIRFIAVNRPGTGKSSASNDWNALSFADDLKHLCDQLLIDRAIVVGFSAGGLYGCAFACKYPQRVERLALLASVGPFDVAEIGDRRTAATRAFHDAARDTPEELLQQFSTISNAEALLQLITSPVATEDQMIFAQPEVSSQLLLSYRDVMAQGLDKFIREIALLNTSWGFSPADIEVETLLWHGTADINIPVECSSYLAEAIPSAKARYLEGAGHFFSFAQWPELLKAISAD